MFEQLWLRLTQALALCRAESGEEAVHAVRTGSRRMEALLRKAMEDHSGAEEMQRAGKKALRRLKKIRKLAGPVRDLDVQRRLIGDLREKTPVTTDAEERKTFEREAERFDRDVRRARMKAARELRKGLGRHELPLERALQRTSKAIAALGAASPLPLSTAKSWTKSSSVATGPLNEENLHAYRKRTKTARYVAELQEGSKAARQFARKLHAVQDAIGLWHDWAMLGREAERFVGDGSLLAPALKQKQDDALAKALRRAVDTAQS